MGRLVLGDSGSLAILSRNTSDAAIVRNAKTARLRALRLEKEQADRDSLVSDKALPTKGGC
jgi:hypothetical protein